MNVLVTANSRHICYLLNIGVSKFCFSLPEDLTVKYCFCIFMIVPAFIFVWKFRKLRRGLAHAHVMRLAFNPGVKITNSHFVFPYDTFLTEVVGRSC